jgi:hypothetical protein
VEAEPVIAYKFLGQGSVGLFSDFAWPAPGEWVETHEPVADCVRGIHAVSFENLLDWIDDELWEIELDGAIVDRPIRHSGLWATAAASNNHPSWVDRVS